MTCLIQAVAKQASLTFRKCFNDPKFPENFEKLRNLVGRITVDDVHFNKSLVSDESVYNPRIQKQVAPVTYIHLYEDDIYSMGIFVLKNGTSLPLHDHPNMFGVCKCIYGKLHVRSFTELKQDSLTEKLRNELKLKSWQEVNSVRKVYDGLKTVTDSSYYLSPDEANFHAICAVDGPAAFLDILAPPYDHKIESRDCHYFRELTHVDGMNSESRDIRWLLKITQPYEFWCDSAPYDGPVITR